MNFYDIIYTPENRVVIAGLHKVLAIHLASGMGEGYQAVPR